MINTTSTYNRQVEIQNITVKVDAGIPPIFYEAPSEHITALEINHTLKVINPNKELVEMRTTEIFVNSVPYLLLACYFLNESDCSRSSSLEKFPTSLLMPNRLTKYFLLPEDEHVKSFITSLDGNVIFGSSLFPEVKSITMFPQPKFQKLTPKDCKIPQCITFRRFLTSDRPSKGGMCCKNDFLSYPNKTIDEENRTTLSFKGESSWRTIQSLLSFHLARADIGGHYNERCRTLAKNSQFTPFKDLDNVESIAALFRKFGSQLTLENIFKAKYQKMLPRTQLPWLPHENGTGVANALIAEMVLQFYGIETELLLVGTKRIASDNPIQLFSPLISIDEFRDRIFMNFLEAKAPIFVSDGFNSYMIISMYYEKEKLILGIMDLQNLKLIYEIPFDQKFPEKDARKQWEVLFSKREPNCSSEALPDLESSPQIFIQDTAAVTLPSSRVVVKKTEEEFSYNDDEEEKFKSIAPISNLPLSSDCKPRLAESKGMIPTDLGRWLTSKGYESTAKTVTSNNIDGALFFSFEEDVLYELTKDKELAKELFQLIQQTR